MRHGRLIALLVALPFLFALGGMVIGAAIGTWMPEYYRSFFRPPYSERMNPVAFGIGQGVTQGFVMGVVVSVIVGIVAALIGTWRGNRVSLGETLEDIRFQLGQLEQAVLRLQDQMQKQAMGLSKESARAEGIQAPGDLLGRERQSPGL